MKRHDTRNDSDFNSYPPIIQSQKVMGRMLNIFVDICEKYNIDYVLMFGTLLGAHRHQGFIPWDGDVDVGIKEEDQLRLKLALLKEIPRDMFYQDRETDPHYKCDLAKLRDRYSNFVEWASKHPQYKHHNGLQLDLFAYTLLDDGKTRRCSFRPREKFDHDDLFGNKATLLFEGRQMRVPTHHVKILKSIYGSLDMPPENKRIAHEGKVDIFVPCDHPESLKWQCEKSTETESVFQETPSLRKRVLVIMGLLEVGGVEKMISKMCKYVEIYCEIHIFSFTAPKETALQWFQGVQIIHGKYSAINLIEYITKNNIEVILHTGSKQFYQMMPDMKNHFGEKVKIIDMIFNTVGHTKNHIKYNEFIDRVIVEYGDMGKWLVENGVKQDKVHVIPNCTQVQEELPTRTGNVTKTVAFLGRLSGEKGPDKFLDIVQESRQCNSFENVRFIMCGDGPLRRALIDRKERDHIPCDFTGVVDTNTFLEKCDCIVVPSVLDGRPNVIMEAMAKGVPVVVSRVGGIPDMVKDTYGAVICDDLSQFVNAIEFCLIHNAEMKASAHSWAKEHFSDANVCEKYLDCFTFQEGSLEISVNMSSLHLVKMVDRIWCINLDDRTDRWAHFQEEMKRVGVGLDEVTRFPAIKNYYGFLGCALSHHHVLKSSIGQTVAVFEDDIEWKCTQQEMENLFAEFQKHVKADDWDVLLLGASEYRYSIQPLEYTKNFARVKSSASALAYIVNAHYVEKLSNNFYESVVGLMDRINNKEEDKSERLDSEFAIDVHWQVLQQKDRWFILTPGIVTQYENYSNIESKVMRYFFY